MKRTMTILAMVSLAAVLATGTFAQAGTYTFDSSVSDWFTGANGFTATNEAANIYGLYRASVAEGNWSTTITDQIRGRLYYTGGTRTQQPTWSGADWTAPAGEVVTEVTISGYFRCDSKDVPYAAVLGGSSTPADTEYMKIPGVTTTWRTDYTNETVLIPEADQVSQLRIKAYAWDEDFYVVLPATDPSYYGRVDSITITTVPEPATMGLLGLGGLAMLKRRSRKA